MNTTRNTQPVVRMDEIEIGGIDDQALLDLEACHSEATLSACKAADSWMRRQVGSVAFLAVYKLVLWGLMAKRQLFYQDDSGTWVVARAAIMAVLPWFFFQSQRVLQDDGMKSKMRELAERLDIQVDYAAERGPSYTVGSMAWAIGCSEFVHAENRLPRKGEFSIK